GAKAPTVHAGHLAKVLRRDAESACQDTGCGPVTAISLYPAADMTQRALQIVIPAIEYGFSGTADNAQITLADADGPLSGHVTIEEYTPFMLRGSFSAERHIVGTFSVAAPWQGDPRSVSLSASDTADDIRQDLVERFPSLSGEALDVMVAEALAHRQAAIDARP
ncbi:MAG: hypothetical protein QGF53_08705, partial [Alphaproteobacteria bacterium]|nr:hypothetical protein [Alphaproteobacteria bacterium]